MSGWEKGEGKEKRGREAGPAPKDKISWEEAQARRVFFKDTRNERKQEAPRGLQGRELKFKMEIYQSSNWAGCSGMRTWARISREPKLQI